MGRPKNIDRSELSPRDQEVYNLLVAGLSRAEIAATLEISLASVMAHRQSIGQRLRLPRGKWLKEKIQ